MQRQVLAAVAVVCVPAAANGQDQILNYFVRDVASGRNLVVIPSVPDGLRFPLTLNTHTKR